MKPYTISRAGVARSRLVTFLAVKLFSIIVSLSIELIERCYFVFQVDKLVEKICSGFSFFSFLVSLGPQACSKRCATAVLLSWLDCRTTSYQSSSLIKSNFQFNGQHTRGDHVLQCEPSIFVQNSSRGNRNVVRVTARGIFPWWLALSVKPSRSPSLSCPMSPTFNGHEDFADFWSKLC